MKYLYVIRNQSKAWQSLQIHERPNDIPQKIHNGIRKDAKEGHRDDYSTQLYVIGNQIKAYRELDSFDWPTDVPNSALRVIAGKAYQDHRTDWNRVRNCRPAVN